MPLIHNTAVVSKKAQIDDDVEIGPFCFIQEDIVIGKGSKLLNNVTIYSGTRIGEKNTIFPGAVLGAVPQDLKFAGEYSELIIGNNNIIRECVTLNRGTKASGKTVVGNNNLFMAYSHVAHDCIVGTNCILANSVALGGHVTIEDYAILGGLVGVHQFVRVGSHVMIGANSMVVKDIVPYSLFDGDPIKYNGINTVGLRRRGFTEEQIETIKKCYTYLYSSGLNVTQAVEQIRSTVTKTQEVNHILSFIKNSTRGIAK
jgi:UDP-N-acetylglucosamine acyltransferase